MTLLNIQFYSNTFLRKIHLNEKKYVCVMINGTLAPEVIKITCIYFSKSKNMGTNIYWNTMKIRICTIWCETDVFWHGFHILYKIWCDTFDTKCDLYLHISSWQLLCLSWLFIKCPLLLYHKINDNLGTDVQCFGPKENPYGPVQC